MKNLINGRAIIRAAILFVLVFGGAMGATAILHPDSPLPNAWNPIRPLVVADAVTPFTDWKLRRTARHPQMCSLVLSQAARVRPASSPQTDNPRCQINAPVAVMAVGDASLGGLETSCDAALRLAMWERHAVQPAAQEILGQTVTHIRDQGSYNCRRIRTASGEGSRWSLHATAEAIDVRGFQLGDGTRIDLIRDWDGDGAKAAFLRAVRDGSCRWFATTLGPDYNALHADHFHLQSRGWGLCK